MAKGRDTWDYLAYYLQLFDSTPPLSELQLFRTPLTPIVVGLPLDLGGIWLLELVFALLYASSILGWSAVALHFGRIPALFSALLLLVYPAYATLFHQASSDAVFATGLAGWALLLVRALGAPSAGRFVALGAGLAALVLIRPANQVLLPLAVASPLVAYVAWRRRLVLAAACVVAAVLPLAAWAVHNGIRYDDTTVARGGRAWIPFLQVFTSNGTISPENGPASERLGELVEGEVLSQEPHAGLDVTLDAYLRNGTNYETVRLIALSDSVLGARRELRRALRLRGRGDSRAPRYLLPRRRRHVLGVPAAEAAPRERRAPRADGAASAGADVRVRRGRAAEPAGHGARRGSAIRLRLVRLGLHRLVHARRPGGGVGRSGDAGALSRGRRPSEGVGRRASGPGRGEASCPRC